MKLGAWHIILAISPAAASYSKTTVSTLAKSKEQQAAVQREARNKVIASTVTRFSFAAEGKSRGRRYHIMRSLHNSTT
jgi:hypothetical protein